MFILYIALIYVLSLNMLVFSSILPGGGLLGLILALVMLLPYANKGKIKIQIPTKSPCFSVLVKYFVLQFFIWSIGIFLGLSSSMHQYAIQTGMMLCFILLLLAMEQSVLEGFIRTYIIFTAVMALTGFVAWCVIHTGYVGIDDFLFNLHDISGGKVADVPQHTYSWPYYLGLVLTKVDINVSSIGSTIFYRASGWATEPAIAALFVMPAIIILILDKHIFRRNLRIVLKTIIISFWIVCAAVSSIISVFLLIVSWLVLSSIKRSAYLRAVLIIITILLITAGMFSFRNDIMNMSGFIQGRLSADSHTFQSTSRYLFWFLYDQSILTALMFSLSLLSAIFVSKIAITGIFRGGYSAVYGYVMLYFVFHCSKGGWVRFIIDPFTMLFFYILVFYIYKQGEFNTQV